MKILRSSAASTSSAFVVAALMALSASAQLNPTVKLLPKPQTSVPPECEQGLAPAVPRAIIAEAAPTEPQPARAVPPPSLDLKTELRAVQLAAERNDRDAFKAGLADARRLVDSYPRGGERNAANDVMGVYNDLERLWDYQMTSPTGAFFDSSTDFVGMMRRYSGYSAAIADQTLTSNGTTLYPTEETRRFLIAEAARRLNQLGVRTPTRITEVPAPAPAPQPRVVPQPVPRTVPEKPAVRKAERATPKKHAPKEVSHRAPKKSKPKPKPLQVAEATPKPSKRTTTVPAPTPTPTPAPAPAPQPVASAPVPLPAPAPVPAPQPAAPTTTTESTPTTTTAEPTTTLPTDTMSTVTSPPPSTETTATATTTTNAPQNQPASGGRVNLLFAIILIIVGIGVLIILFRASD